MRSAADILLQFADFSVFCRQPHLYKHTLCKVSDVKLYLNAAQNRIRLTITADRFLRGMIRLIVSFLLKIGEGKMTLQEFEQMLSSQVQASEKPAALPNGLYLSGVEYPYLKLAPTNDVCGFLNIGLED
jgi:tRNA pseudouridine38-40 synthase